MVSGLETQKKQKVETKGKKEEIERKRKENNTIERKRLNWAENEARSRKKFNFVREIRKNK